MSDLQIRVAPKSRRDIRYLAKTVRSLTGHKGSLWFPVLEFAELVLPVVDPHYHFEVAGCREMGSSHGLTQWSGENAWILIREDVYENALRGLGRDRGTVAHEIGHYFMHARSQSLARAFSENVRTYEDPEWQAMCFQGELLVPFDEVLGMTPLGASQKCGVSYDCAEYQLGVYARQRKTA